MKVQVKFFGRLVELTGHEQLEVSDIKDLNGLKEKLLTTFPLLQKQQFIISVNKKVTSKNCILESENEIAFLPPFAGG